MQVICGLFGWKHLRFSVFSPAIERSLCAPCSELLSPFTQHKCTTDKAPRLGEEKHLCSTDKQEVYPLKLSEAKRRGSNVKKYPYM